MLAITIVLFVVPHNQQIVKVLQFFHIPYFSVRNQNLNIQKSHSGMNGSHLKLSKESITCTTPGSFSYSSFLLAESTTTIL